MYFSPQGEKIPKELLRLSPQTPMRLSGSVYTRLPTRVCVPQRVRKPRRNTPCGKYVRLGSLHPQAQGARRVSAFRYDIDEHGGG